MKFEYQTLLEPARTESQALSVVVPLLNEEAVLPAFHSRLMAVLVEMGVQWEIVYVDDGSSDNTWSLLKHLHARDCGVTLMRFSRNFGKEAAVSAGLRASTGDAVVIIDADLQDPPETIPRMLRAWREDGADLVNMRRSSRPGEGIIKRWTAFAFYRVFNKVAEVPIPADVGDFRLLSRRVVDALNQLPERNRFLKGLFAWVGFHQVTLDYDRHPRAAGQTKWPYLRLWRFALEGITGFSVAPLKLATYLGFLFAAASLFLGGRYLVKTLLLGDPVPGFPTLAVAVFLLGGLQLMAIGVIGEYLARLFLESKQRPLFLVQEYQPATQRSLV